MKRCATLLFFLAAVTASSYAQLQPGLSYTHLSGNSGLDGFTGSVNWKFGRQVQLFAEADVLWDTSRVGVFDLAPSTGAISIKSNQQSYMAGARVFIRGWGPMQALEKRRLRPFGEFSIGVSRLGQTVADALGTITTDAADTGFTWHVGGGADYPISRKWVGRGRIGFVRTHFVDEGQSRLRFSLGVAYLF